MTTVVETKERLTQVIRVIEGLPKEAQWRLTWIGCPLGHASRDPYFVIRGFKWSNAKGCPVYMGLGGVIGAMEFLGLSHDDFVVMFLRMPPLSRVEVVRAIKAHIAGLEG